MDDFEGTKKNFVLMNKNVKVLRLTYDLELHIATDFIEKINAEFAPVGIINYKSDLSKSLFNDWWRKRAIPSSRDHIQPFLEKLNMLESVELLEKGYGLSLSDQYWLKEDESSLQWKDINYFENNFSEDVGNVLFGSEELNGIDLKSPDNSSDGNLQKKWKIINGDRCLIKAGNLHNNQEPYNELIASKLGELILGPKDYVTYSLLEDNGRIYSSCKTMNTTNNEFVAAHYIDQMTKSNGKENYDRYLDICDILEVPDAQLQINKMIVVDYLLANYDRHWRNFGLIRDVNTLKWIKVAPIFDTGSSLWAIGFKDEIGLSDKSKCFATTNKKQLDQIEDLSWLDIEALDDFPDIMEEILLQNRNLDKETVSKIKNAVINRIEVLEDRRLELSRIKENALDK